MAGEILVDNLEPIPNLLKIFYKIAIVEKKIIMIEIKSFLQS